MHEFEDSFRNQRKFRIRGKWELILVLLVVIAGVVVTTIAVLKAKEKRESLHHLEANDNIQVIDSSSTRLQTVDSHQQVRAGQKDKRNDEQANGHKSNANADQRSRNTSQNRYQAEKEFGGDLGGYESAPESRRVRVKASEVPEAKETGNNKQQPSEKQAKAAAADAASPRGGHHSTGGSDKSHSPMLRYDGLPGYPPPPGFDPAVFFMDKANNNNNNNQSPNVEFSANSAGFILSDIAASASEEQPNKVMRKWTGDETLSEQPAAVVIVPSKAQQPQSSQPQQPQNWHINLEFPSSTQMMMIKPETRVHTTKQQPQVHKVATNMRANPSSSAATNVATRTSNPDIFRVLGYENGANYLSANELIWLQQTRPELFQGPHEASSSKHVTSVNRRYKRDDVHELMKHPHQEKPHIRRKARSKYYEEEPSKPSPKPHLHKSPKEGKKKPNKRYLNKYVQHEHEQPPPQHKKKSHKNKKSHKKRSEKKGQTKKKNRYSKEESKRVEKFDILGSGNFEIIRGGILDKTSEEKGYKMKSESEGKNRKIGKKDRPDSAAGQQFEDSYPANDNATTNDQTDANGNDEEQNGNNGNDNNNKGTENGDGGESDGDNFEPFNFDLFSSDPILQGFQGYDNFDASRNDLTKVHM